jgi:heme oxygenase (biliverdin-producing, ferredoxin)
LNPETGSLPQRLKLATLELHTRAERSGVMAHLLAGRLSRDAYVALLVNLQAIYRSLEPAVLAQNWPLPLAALARSAALQSDLKAFGTTTTSTPTPATQEYVLRLEALVGAQAHRLWAHIYVRYLGDLYGGQILGRRVSGLFEVDNSTGFYDFGSSEQVSHLRNELRGALDSRTLTPAQCDDVVQEALWAFEAHCRIFEQIESRT